MNKWIKRIIVVLIIALLLIPIFKEMKQNSGFKTIKYNDFSDVVKNTTAYKFALVYVAPGSSENLKDKKESIKSVLEKYKKDEEDLKVYFIDADNIDSKAISKLHIDETTGESYIFISNEEVIKYVSGKLDKASLEALVKEYSANGIDENLMAYKVAENAKAFEKTVDKKSITMAVFGRDNCYYCKQFLPVVNTVAEEYELKKVYYFDSNNYDEKEYDKIMDMGLKIPASCSSTEKETKLEPGFGTPLTLFTKNGKVFDCINGYVNKETLVTKLETIGMIKED